jgi:hypothetical protein
LQTGVLVSPGRPGALGKDRCRRLGGSPNAPLWLRWACLPSSFDRYCTSQGRITTSGGLRESKAEEQH